MFFGKKIIIRVIWLCMILGDVSYLFFFFDVLEVFCDIIFLRIFYVFFNLRCLYIYINVYKFGFVLFGFGCLIIVIFI